MITAKVVTRPGEFELSISGHGSKESCAAVTAMEQTVAIWLEQLAELMPADLTLTISEGES